MSDQHREVIDRFTGPYAFLSNFHPCRVTFYGMTFPSVEAAFKRQSVRTTGIGRSFWP